MRNSNQAHKPALSRRKGTKKATKAGAMAALSATPLLTAKAATMSSERPTKAVATCQEKRKIFKDPPRATAKTAASCFIKEAATQFPASHPCDNSHHRDGDA